MITITKNKKLSFQEMKLPYNIVAAARDAKAKSVDYEVCRTEKDAGLVLLVSKEKLDAAVAALDTGASLAVKMKTLDMAMQVAGVRAEEVYRMVLAQSSFPGNDEYSDALDNQALEKKINDKGTQFDNQVENKVAASGGVVASFPIADLASVSARKAGGPLTVTSVPDLQLGVVNLNDGGSPVANGVAVELVYQTKEHLVINLTDQNKKVVACLVSKELMDYLAANAV